MLRVVLLSGLQNDQWPIHLVTTMTLRNLQMALL